MRTVLITGVSSGIGKSIAEELLNNNLTLLLTFSCFFILKKAVSLAAKNADKNSNIIKIKITIYYKAIIFLFKYFK